MFKQKERKRKSVIWIKHLNTSRSEQAQGSEFHPRDKSEKNDYGFLGPSWCNKRVNPETYVPCGSYELLLSNVAHQIKEKLTIQKNVFPFVKSNFIKI